MHLGVFLHYTAQGTALWSGLLAYGGMVLGAQYERIIYFLEGADFVLIGLLVAGAVWWVVRRRRRQRQVSDEQQPGE